MACIPTKSWVWFFQVHVQLSYIEQASSTLPFLLGVPISSSSNALRLVLIISIQVTCLPEQRNRWFWTAGPQIWWQHFLQGPQWQPIQNRTLYVLPPFRCYYSSQAMQNRTSHRKLKLKHNLRFDCLTQFESEPQLRVWVCMKVSQGWPGRVAQQNSLSSTPAINRRLNAFIHDHALLG